MKAKKREAMIELARKPLDDVQAAAVKALAAVLELPEPEKREAALALACKIAIEGKLFEHDAKTEEEPEAT